MRVTYCLNFEDYYDASQVRTAKARFLSRCALLAMAVLLGVRILRSAAVSIERNYLSLGAMVVLLVVLPEAVRRLNKLYLRYANTKASNPEAGKEISVDIQQHEIQVVGVPDRQEWSYFSNYQNPPMRSFFFGQIPSKQFFPNGPSIVTVSAVSAKFSKPISRRAEIQTAKSW